MIYYIASSSKQERILSERTWSRVRDVKYLMFSESLSICMIALLDSYMEVDVTRAIPGVSAIRSGCAEEQMARITTVVLQVRCVLVPNL